jgi:hypothetical protein
MKISYVMNVLNGEPFISYQLDSIYNYAHEIIIVEGAYQKFAHAAVNGRSIDRTIELIKNYPDPEKKIQLIIKPGYYYDRTEMCNEFLKYISGEVVWQLDVDEFYLPETHSYVSKLFAENNNIDQVSFCFNDYFYNTRWIIKGYPESLGDVIRVNRFKPGMRWSSQRPPTLQINGHVLSPRVSVSGRQMKESGHIMHNATMIFDNQVKSKFTYYSSMWSNVSSGESDWYKCTWLSLQNYLSIAGLRDSITYLVENQAKVPTQLLMMVADVGLEKYQGFNLRNDDAVVNLVHSSKYGYITWLADAINNLSRLNPIKKIYIVMIALLATIFLLNSRSGSHARRVIFYSVARDFYRVIKLSGSKK